MKIRTGFVSNSSSSSFICVGVKLTDEEINKLFPPDPNDEFGDGRYELFEKEGIFNPTESNIYGIKILDQSNENGYLEDGSISSDEFEKLKQQVVEKYKVSPDKVKIFYGTYPS